MKIYWWVLFPSLFVVASCYSFEKESFEIINQKFITELLEFGEEAKLTPYYRDKHIVLHLKQRNEDEVEIFIANSYPNCKESYWGTIKLKRFEIHLYLDSMFIATTSNFIKLNQKDTCTREGEFYMPQEHFYKRIFFNGSDWKEIESSWKQVSIRK